MNCADEIEVVASEAFGFYGITDARKIAAKNAMNSRLFSRDGQQFWLAVWKRLLTIEDQG